MNAENDPRLEILIGFVKEASKGGEGLLVPVSGGTDSALTYWICTQARPNEVLAVHTNDEPLRSQEWFESLGELKTIWTPGEFREREEMRWARFLNMSIVREYDLVGSRNRTEHHLGIYSLATRVAMLYPLLGVWKTDVIELCKTVGVPQEIIASSSEADCDCGRPEMLAEIPFSLTDAFLKSKLGENVDLSGLTEDQTNYLQGVYDYTLFKRNLPLSGPIVPSF